MNVRIQGQATEIPRWITTALNQLYEVERKLTVQGDPSNALRNVARIKDAFEEVHAFYDDPMGQPFNETRTDVEATISGSGTENLVIVEVLKPIVRIGTREYSRVIQKGIVIAESTQTAEVSND
jgi:hypothetical protein